MDKKIKILLILMWMLITSTMVAIAAPKKRVAVLSFIPNKVANHTANAVRDLFEVYFYKTGVFDVIERNQVDLILKEQGFALTGCVDTSCAVKIGKMLSVDMVAIGSIIKLDGYTITIRLADVAQGTVNYAETGSQPSEDKLTALVQDLSQKTARHFTNKLSSGMVTPTGITADYYFRGIIPGWAQFYSGNSNKGFMFSSSFLVSGSFALWAYYNYTKKKDAYNNLGIASKEVYTKKYNEYKTATTIGRVSLGICAAVYALNWLDVILFPGFNNQKIGSQQELKKYYFSLDSLHYKDYQVITIGYGMRF